MAIPNTLLNVDYLDDEEVETKQKTKQTYKTNGSDDDNSGRGK